MKKVSVLGIVIFIICLCLIVVIAKCNDSKLLKNHGILNAVITDVVKKKNSGGAFFIKYKFFVMGYAYYGSTSPKCKSKFRTKLENYLTGRRVTVVYEKTRPYNNEILLTSEDFKKYNTSSTSYDSVVMLEICKICENCD